MKRLVAAWWLFVALAVYGLAFSSFWPAAAGILGMVAVALAAGRKC